eukprot:CAMPEP_0204836926 /NCGR_PEP_ID=MMETSP1346-20131115/26602_1 /ASSEMBLY_ACC=CAM_ASM_000771 /TAXON_ID=215587 /ORGANISM="Aplanochytrium stocchinoi, Strain GSBS06" /LENGTH=101 /DNA_ID=CAMNT_0051972049 /DNA_START=649 /DNA_END=957 /DNA_ORIENTATION=+
MNAKILKPQKMSDNPILRSGGNNISNNLTTMNNMGPRMMNSQNTHGQSLNDQMTFNQLNAMHPMVGQANQMKNQLSGVSLDPFRTGQGKLDPNNNSFDFFQ